MHPMAAQTATAILRRITSRLMLTHGGPKTRWPAPIRLTAPARSNSSSSSRQMPCRRPTKRHWGTEGGAEWRPVEATACRACTACTACTVCLVMAAAIPTCPSTTTSGRAQATVTRATAAPATAIHQPMGIKVILCTGAAAGILIKWVEEWVEEWEEWLEIGNRASIIRCLLVVVVVPVVLLPTRNGKQISQRNSRSNKAVTCSNKAVTCSNKAATCTRWRHRTGGSSSSSSSCINDSSKNSS